MTNFRTMPGHLYAEYKKRLDVMDALDEAQQEDLTDVLIMGTKSDGTRYVKQVRQPDNG